MITHMLIAPVVQRETGLVVSYMVSMHGKGLCFGKTHTEALTRAMTMILAGVRVLPVQCMC